MKTRVALILLLLYLSMCLAQPDGRPLRRSSRRRPGRGSREIKDEDVEADPLREDERSFRGRRGRPFGGNGKKGGRFSADSLLANIKKGRTDISGFSRKDLSSLSAPDLRAALREAIRSRRKNPFSRPVDFDVFRRQNGRSYRSKRELEKRKALYKQNTGVVRKINEKFIRGSANFFAEANKFSDYDTDEVKRLFTGHVKSPTGRDRRSVDASDIEDTLTKYIDAHFKRNKRETNNSDCEMVCPEPQTSAEPDVVGFDWREENPDCIQDIRDQGRCGSCWAFSAAETLEDRYCIAGHGALPSLSQQELTDCTYTRRRDGCKGGFGYQALQYVTRRDRIAELARYPYRSGSTGRDGSCRSRRVPSSGVEDQISAIRIGRSLSNQELKDLLEEGPIAVAIFASHREFIYYKRGILECPKVDDLYDLDHEVTLVSWGEDAVSGEYWCLKNQWGTDWGDNGYVCVSMDQNKNCGLHLDVTWPEFKSSK